jgi:MFS family permease
MFSSLKNYNFRIFFLAQSFSVVGTFAQEIAQAWLVLSLTHSAAALGFVIGLQYLPMLVIAPIGGVLADRFSRRKLLLITQSAYAMLIFVMWGLTITHLIHVWMIFILAFGMGITGALNTPTRLGFLHDLVGDNDLQNAVSLNATVYSTGRVLGPAAAGAIIALLGVGPCFLLNAISYIGVIVALGLLRVEELRASPKIAQARGQFKAGVNYIRRTPTLLAILTMTLIIGIFTSEFPVSLPALAKNTFHGNATTLAAFASAYGLGATLGGLASARFKHVSPSALAQMAAILGIAVMAVAIQPTPLLVILVMIGVGYAIVRYTSSANTMLQLTALPAMRGRVLAFWSAAYLGSTALGGPIVGWISQAANPRWALGVGGIAALVAAIIGSLYFRSSKFEPIRPNQKAA